MRRSALYLSVLLLVISGCVFANYNKTYRSVLMVHSHNPLYQQWAMSPFQYAMDASDYQVAIKRVSLHVDEGTKYADWEEKFYEFLPDIQAGKYDVILVLNDAAYDLFCKHAEEIPPAVPVVFSHVMTFSGVPSKHTNMTGNYGTYLGATTADLAMRMLPDNRHIILMTNKSDSGIEVRRQLIRWAENNRNVKLTVLCGEDNSATDAFFTVKRNQDDSILIFFQWYDKFSGNIESGDRLLIRIATQTRIPVFRLTVFDEHQQGVIGGIIPVPLTDCLKDAADIVLEIFGGKKASDIPVRRLPPMTVLNYPVLKKLGLNPGNFESGIVWLNKPESHFSRFITEITVAAVIMLAVLVGSIGSLVWYIRIKRKIWQDANIFSRLPLLFIVADANGKVYKYQRMTIADSLFEGENFGNVSQLKDKNLRELVKERICEAIRTQAENTVDFDRGTVKKTARVIPVDKEVFGEPTAIWIAMDTTDLQNLKITAQNYSRQLELTIQSIGVVIVVTDEYERITMMNHSAENLFGFKEADLIGQKLSSSLFISYSEDGTPVECPVAECLREKRVMPIRTVDREITTGKHNFYAEFGASPIISVDGRLSGAILYIRDISEQFRLKEKTKQLVAFYERLLDFAPFYFYTKRMTGGRFVYDYVNEFSARAVGKKREDIYGKSDEELGVSPEDAEKMQRQDFEAMKSAQALTWIDRLSFKDGPGIWVQTYKKAINNADGRIIIAGSGLDITEIEEQKDQLRSAVQEARTADNFKRSLIEQLSSEIREPLNSVASMADKLLETEVSAGQRDFITSIKDTGNSLLELNRNLLDIIQLDAGQFKLNYQTCNVKTLIEEAVAKVRKRAELCGVELKIDLPAELPQMELDPVRLQQIFLNLLDNVVVCSDRGSIILRLRTKALAGVGLLNITITDTSSGIKTENQDADSAIFNTQGHADGKLKRQRYGLTLTIARKLAEAMGGEITVRNNPDVGRVFTLTLKNVKFMEPAKQEAAVNKGADEEHIILVDDVPMNLRVLSLMLGKMKLKSIQANSAAEALAVMENKSFRLMMTDIWMPEVNGIELAKKVRENPAMDNMSIIAVTADIDAASNFDMSIFDAVLIKPVTMEKLKEISAICSQKTGNREQGTGNREQGTGNREQGTGNREQGELTAGPNETGSKCDYLLFKGKQS